MLIRVCRSDGDEVLVGDERPVRRVHRPTSSIVTVAPPSMSVLAAMAPVLPDPTTMNSGSELRSM